MAILRRDGDRDRLARGQRVRASWLRNRLDNGGKIGGSGQVNSIRRPSVRMMEDEAVRVKERPIEPRQRPQVAWQVPSNPAVERVADNRMADGAEMHADLVRAPGRDRHVEQRHAPGSTVARVIRVTAVRARRARADIFCRFAGSRPIGASMRRPACTTPQTSAMYSFSTSRS